MDGYYVVGLTVISCLGYGCIITMVRKQNKTYLVSITDFMQCNCLDCAKMLSMAMKKRGHSKVIHNSMVSLSF